MSSAIRNIITSTLVGEGINVEDYAEAIDIVTGALAEEAYETVEAIVERLRELRVNELDVRIGTEQDVRAFLASVGLPTRPPREAEPAPQVSHDEVEARVARLEQIIEPLDASLREELAGLKEAVAELKALAARHLGTTS
jgi:tetrahydromethanopterin S-methyltransferase subunit B